jgi:hypothetical protein
MLNPEVEPIVSSIAVDSSSLAAVSYSSTECWLEVCFRDGQVYRYFGVPPQCYRELLEAESKGAYFNRRIRNRFAFQRVATDNPVAEGPMLAKSK